MGVFTPLHNLSFAAFATTLAVAAATSAAARIEVLIGRLADVKDLT